MAGLVGGRVFGFVVAAGLVAGRAHPNRKVRDEDWAPGLVWMVGLVVAEPTLIAKCAMRMGHPVLVWMAGLVGLAILAGDDAAGL